MTDDDQPQRAEVKWLRHRLERADAEIERLAKAEGALLAEVARLRTELRTCQETLTACIESA